MAERRASGGGESREERNARLSLHRAVARALGFSEKEATGKFRNMSPASFQRATGISKEEYAYLGRVRERQGTQAISQDKTILVRGWINTEPESTFLRLGMDRDKVLERFTYFVEGFDRAGMLTDKLLDELEREVKTNGLSIKKGRKARDWAKQLDWGEGEVEHSFWDTP